MQTSILPVISECVIAFNLQLQQYITIGSSISMLSGYPENSVPTEINFWHAMIHPKDTCKVHEALNELTEGMPVEVSYRIVPHGQPGIHHITEKRSLYTDAITGHQVLLSVLNEYNPSAMGERSTKEDPIKREQFLQSLINSQTNFMVRLDTTGCFTFVNKRYCDVFGYTERELLGSHFAITTAPEDMERCQLAFERCLASPGNITSLVREKLDKTGERHPTEWEFISIINEVGDVTEIQGVGQDISERVKNEEQVKRTAEQLNDFIESITDAFIILDNQWRFIKTNGAFQNVAHKTEEQLIGKNIWEMFPTLKGRLTEEMLHRAVETKQTIKFTEYFARPKLWFRVAAYPSSEGLTIFVKNITRQKVAEEELNSTRNNLESLINNTNDLIWAIDTNNHYIYVNTSYKSAVYNETGELPVNGDELIIFGPEKTVELWAGYYQRALNGERYTLIYENAHTNPAESSYYEVNFNPIYNEAHEIVGTGCFAREITSRLRSEREIIAQNERLRNIASLSSHELRRPVASMLGLINVIDFENFGTEENREAINLLLVVGNEIDEVIKAIVDSTFTGDSPIKNNS
jgi:PAS domain S-box-containing protein